MSTVSQRTDQLPGLVTNNKKVKSTRDGAAAAEGETLIERCAAELRPWLAASRDRRRRETGWVVRCALHVSWRAGERLSLDGSGRPPGEDRTCSEVGGVERETVRAGPCAAPVVIDRRCAAPLSAASKSRGGK